MNVLGIESSCDETAAAVVTDGRHARSSVIWSQVAVHAPFGGSDARRELPGAALVEGRHRCRPDHAA